MKDPAERLAFYNKQCELANNVLQRLNPGTSKQFLWSEHKATYYYGDDGGYKYLTDRGEWFSLDYLGRPLGQTPEQWQAGRQG